MGRNQDKALGGLEEKLERREERNLRALPLPSTLGREEGRQVILPFSAAASRKEEKEEEEGYPPPVVWREEEEALNGGFFPRGRRKKEWMRMMLFLA